MLRVGDDAEQNIDSDDSSNDDDRYENQYHDIL